jgi:hypothetical protein
MHLIPFRPDVVATAYSERAQARPSEREDNLAVTRRSRWRTVDDDEIWVPRRRRATVDH